MNKFEIFSPGDFGGFTIPHERYEEINSKLICVFACFNINTEILWGRRLSFLHKRNRVCDFIGDITTVNFSWTWSIRNLIFVHKQLLSSRSIKCDNENLIKIGNIHIYNKLFTRSLQSLHSIRASTDTTFHYHMLLLLAKVTL